MLKSRIVAAALMAATVAGCDKASPPVSEARPVRTVTVQHSAEGEIVSLTGQVRAKDEVSLAFRLDGRMIERPVHVGDVLKAGQVVARLDPQIQNNSRAIGGSQSRLARGDADPGAPHLLAAAGTAQGRLDPTRQFRRGPAEAPERPGPGRLGTGAVADRSGTAGLHGFVRRRPGRRHRGRRRAGGSGPRRADGCAARTSGRPRRRVRRP